MAPRKVFDLQTPLSQYVLVQDAARTPDVFGVEVEVEGQHLTGVPPAVNVHWRQVEDGSLRVFAPDDQATEYVLRQPLDLPTLGQAVTDLTNFLQTPPTRVYDSYRTSIHVHVNCAQETLMAIYNYITLSLIFDELLVSQNGEHRIGNNFCLRAKDAMGQLLSLTTSMEKGKEFFNFNEADRYSSVNFASLLKFGSLEFRSLECTTHAGRIMHWVQTLQQMKERARLFTNPMEIVQLYSRLGPQEFLRHVLGPFSLKYSSVSGVDSMLHNGMRLAQSVAYSRKWDKKVK